MGELGTCDHCGNYANWCDECLEKGRNSPSVLSAGVIKQFLNEEIGRLEEERRILDEQMNHYKAQQVVQQILGIQLFWARLRENGIAL